MADGLSRLPRVRPETRVRVPQHVLYREFPTQTVVLDLQTGRYHGLRPTAGRMLVALQQAPNIAGAARIVSERYGEPRANVERDLCELCAGLLKHGMLELVTKPTAR